MSKGSFLKEFFKAKRMVGAIVPSSRFLAKKMLKSIDFQKAKVIIELGPGTGVFTKEIIAQLNKETQLIVIELNDAFYDALNNRYHESNLHIKHGSAADINIILEQLKLPKADFIISSLPLSNFSVALREEVLEKIKLNLKSEGKYIQFQYTRQLKKLYSIYFKKVAIGYTLLNIPPAFVYTCSNS